MTIGDDGTFMSKLAKSLSPTPSSWSISSNFCTWNGVKCDQAHRVTSIDLSSKSLNGTLPSDLNSLSQLTSLFLQSNSLSGALPSLANLALLQTVSLGQNNFLSVPVGCFKGLTDLQTLSMSFNNDLAPWTFPTDLAESSSLVSLDLGGTNLEGSLPDIFDSLVNLQELRLSYNNLTGDLPKSFSVSGIKNMWLNNQNDMFGFTGSIDVLASMTHAAQVDRKSVV